MVETVKVCVPDIGGAKGVDVIEILVKPGDSIQQEQGLITLEGDKATMEIPSPFAGVVESIDIKLGDKVEQGAQILTLVPDTMPLAPQAPKAAAPEPVKPQTPKTDVQQKSTVEVHIPDIGGAKDVDVIEILVKTGDSIKKDQGLITLEGDKATMEIPSPFAGVVQSLALKLGDKVSQGSLVLTLLATDVKPSEPAITPAEKPQTQPETPPVPSSVPTPTQAAKKQPLSPAVSLSGASPAVRRLARELGVDLALVAGSGRKDRITKEDIQAYVKNIMQQPTAARGLALPEAVTIDFSQFGPIETKPLHKIKRLTAVNVHRSWVTIPHVTQFDAADITDLEAFRKESAASQKDTSYKLTLLAFVCKVVSKALAVFPQFNASLDTKGESLIYKQYFHIGIAVETPQGLVVPVIRDVNQLSVVDIAKEMGRLSAKAREKGLGLADMSGGCFTISSLGGIGGTAFTPIVNAPEVAILGLSRSSMQPVYEKGQFVPRLMLPLSLSYDHRVIDGAEAARFTRYISDSLADIRRILL